MNEKTPHSSPSQTRPPAAAPGRFSTPPPAPPVPPAPPAPAAPVDISAAAPAAPQRDWHRILLYAAIIVATGLFVASPAFHGTWLWDDDQEISANAALTSVAGLKEIWKGNVGADYLPVKTTILWIEWQIWQYDNTCYHIINAIWHVINALLIWRLFSLLRMKWAWIGGLLFAIHPVLVESVAWVSEQKNTISLIFMLLSAITFIKYHEGGKPANLVMSCVMFLAALLSKSAVIMLPFAFILYAWWRDDSLELDRMITFPVDLVKHLYGKLKGGQGKDKPNAQPEKLLDVLLGLRDILIFAAIAAFCGAVAFGTIIVMRMLVGAETIASQANTTSTLIKMVIAPTGSLIWAAFMILALAVAGGFACLWSIMKGRQWRAILKLALSTVPFFAMAMSVALITVYFQHKNAIGAEVIPVGGKWSRIVIAGFAVFFYLKQCAWPFEPFGLIPIYPRWEVPENPSLWMFLPWVAFFALIYLFWVYRKTWGRHMILGLGFFFGFLVPVLGFVDMSYMRITWVADHFLYISVIGVIGLIVAGAAKIFDYIPKKGKPWAMGFGIAGIALVAMDANLYSDVFLNETNMWRYTLSKNPNAWQAHSRYGKVLLDSGNRDAAYYHIQQSNRLRPDLAETNNNMGVLLLQKGRGPEALPYFGRAVRLMPIGAFLLNHANALTQAQQGAQAAPVYEKLFRAEGGQLLGRILKERGYAALEKLFAEKGGVTLGEVVNAPGGEALGRLIRKKAGSSYERLLALRGGAAVEELVKLRLSDALEDILKAKSVERLEDLVRAQGGPGLESMLRSRGILNDLLKLNGGDALAEVLKKTGYESFLAFRGLRGSDSYETMILAMREEPLPALLAMRGGDQLAQLLKMNGGESILKLRQMEGTEVLEILKEMMGGDPIARLLELDGGNPILWTNYGVALMQANRREDAVLALQKALKINPNLPDARRNLEIALGTNQMQATPPVQQDLRFPMSNMPGTAGVPLQIPSIFLPTNQ